VQAARFPPDTEEKVCYLTPLLLWCENVTAGEGNKRMDEYDAVDCARKGKRRVHEALAELTDALSATPAAGHLEVEEGAGHGQRVEGKGKDPIRHAKLVAREEAATHALQQQG
jgi:hypothetical protein